MTAATYDNQSVQDKPQFPPRHAVPVAASTLIYKNTIVCVDSNGRAVPGADTAGLQCAGIARAQADNSSGAAAAIKVEVQYGTRYLMTCSGITQAMLGDALYVLDDQTLVPASGATNDIFAGVLVEYVSPTLGWVAIPGLGGFPVSALTVSPSELNKLDAVTGYPVEAIEVDFTETSGAGTYTGSVAVPAGATILDIIVNGVALWNNAGACTLKVGDVADDDGYYTAVDLKATDLLAGESLSFALAGGKAGAYIANSQVSPRYSASARTISGIITTASTGGSTGRTRMVVVFVLPTSTAATKA